jgi:crotonobetainyl-CoA:carnitine CoA-transferase CaiB-like acyl-CoA transferase
MTALLHDLTVVDCSQGLSGPFCAMMLGDLGARVLKVEPLEGDWARQLEPCQGSHSAVFLALNRNKESLAIARHTAPGQEILHRLVRRADMVICDEHPAYAQALGLDYPTLVAHNPQLIYGLVTPFGEHGPWAQRMASELVVQAASGYPRYLGHYGQAPVRLGADVASMAGGIFLLQGLLAALFCRLRQGCGQSVAVSQLGALYALKTIQIAAQYRPDTWEGYHCWGPYNPPDTGWQTQDRPIVFSFGEFTGGGPDKQSQWPAFCRAVGLEHLLADPRFDQDGKNSTGLGADVAPLRSLYEAALRQHPAAELVELIRHLEGAAYPYHTYATLFTDAQAQVLQLLQQIPRPEGELTAIRAPWNFSGLQTTVRCGPPTLGNTTERVLAELGYDAATCEQFFAAGTVSGTRAPTYPVVPEPSGPRPTPRTAPAMLQHRGGPLAGLRVMDISGLGVGPVTGLFLAELGAEVTKVEPPHGDLALTVLPRQRGTSVLYISANLCKRGVILNLKLPRDLDRAYRLAERSDVFLENFRVGVVERLGLGYTTLAERNPRLIYCSLSGFGPLGPLARLPSVDPYIQAFSGFASLNGPPGSQGESLRNIGFIDLTTSALAVPAILAALLAREHTGQGQHIVASMLQAAVTLQTSRVAEFLATGHPAAPCGSGMPYAVPDQAFQVRDGYLAVSARTPAEWERLCRALGQEALLADPRYRTLADRITHRATLVAHLAAIFGVYPAAWWLQVLGQAGVPCGRFYDYEAMCQHPQVRHNALMVEVPTPHWGTVRVAGLPWSFSVTPGVLHAGPLPGSDTATVLAQLDEDTTGTTSAL